MDNFTLCALCDTCKGCAYQSPPVYYVGNIKAPILVLGQNPGEIKPDDMDRKYAAMRVSAYLAEYKGALAPEVVRFYYELDFGRSHARTVLDKVLWEGWMESGSVCYSNAVRCRTEANAMPSKEMIANCAFWTRQLLTGKHAIIMMGAVARDQVLGKDSERLDWYVPKKHPQLGYILAIHHYAAREFNMKDAKEGVNSILKKLKEDGITIK